MPLTKSSLNRRERKDAVMTRATSDRLRRVTSLLVVIALVGTLCPLPRITHQTASDEDASEDTSKGASEGIPKAMIRS